MWIPERLYTWWWGQRLAESEAINSEEEVEAYTNAAAQRYLAKLDEDAARRATPLFRKGRHLIDLGCGPAAIPLSVAERVPGLKIVGVDLSVPMLRRAQQEAARRGLQDRLQLVCADAAALPFRDGCFDGVCSNSLIHHLARPQRAMQELSRVAPAGTPLFLRDLRRPPRLWMRAHLAIFGRRYRGAMRRLFDDSVRAAYTRAEMGELVLPLGGVRVDRRGGAHIEAIRPGVR